MILWLALLILALVYRISAPFVHWLPNFAPLMAIAFCGSVYTRRKSALLFPLIALALSDLFLNAYYHAPLFGMAVLARYFCYGAAAWLGLAVARHKSWVALLGGALGCSVLFYLVTNSLAWLADPVYAKSAAGWLQALTVGEPGYPSTIFFFRNTLAGDLAFTLFFAGCMEFAASCEGRSHLWLSGVNKSPVAR